MRATYRLPLALAITTLAAPALAGPASFKDARSFAMGGTGVAAARPSGASFFNPALLAVQHTDEKNDFGLMLPAINVQAADEDEMVDQVDDLQDQIDDFNAIANRFESAVNSGNIPAADQARIDAQKSAGTLSNSLINLSGDKLRADIGAGIAAAIPSETLALGIFVDGSARLFATPTLGAGDQSFLQNVANGTLTPDQLDEIGGRDMDSYAQAVALGMVEVGVTLARKFDIQGNPLSFGVSPKLIEIHGYHYASSLSNFEEDDFDDARYESSDTAFNLDIGAAYQFGKDSEWTAGFAIRNLIPMEIKSKQVELKNPNGVIINTLPGSTLELNPQTTLGIAHSGEWHTLTADLELLKNETSFSTGLRTVGYDSQFLSLGGEFDLYHFLQVRAGLRQNLASNSGNNSSTHYTAGLGLSPFGVRMDLSALYADNEYGAAAELGFAF